MNKPPSPGILLQIRYICIVTLLLFAVTVAAKGRTDVLLTDGWSIRPKVRSGKLTDTCTWTLTISNSQFLIPNSQFLIPNS